MDKENTLQATWNKKRIIAAIILLVLFGIGIYLFKTKFLDEKVSLFVTKRQESSSAVKGVNTKKDERSLDIQKAVKEKIKDLKQQASKIDVAEIASSSPQIQKLIKDLSSIKDYPVNQAKEICEKVCGNL